MKNITNRGIRGNKRVGPIAQAKLRALAPSLRTGEFAY